MHVISKVVNKHAIGQTKKIKNRICQKECNILFIFIYIYSKLMSLI